MKKEFQIKTMVREYLRPWKLSALALGLSVRIQRVIYSFVCKNKD